ncbi:uncharacterized protein LOC108036215 [Drosophila biarmipes]|uniref:uncharacterized protein LOC108036215 n=1 Tax=Drosophila biarmipes TaxID=125945 RepID=UPI001CDA7558|nr:uncharacterized protein LOC108036215 [Drosophila biarmipes]XP_043947866.1 uncharacterized protein LOC108036215 [Drosophila biarmipes]XP_043947867.1 uncharacterized protein LOC108036215 [Drosophila biarmipes]
MSGSENVLSKETCDGNPFSVELKESIWYTTGELVEMLECPGCGISMVSFKNRLSHVKKCFSIKRRGPLYRIYGYAECKCGLLIADTLKAQKLHCCSGKVRPWKPPKTAPSIPPKSTADNSPTPPTQFILKSEPVKPTGKTWIRNFISPIKQNNVSSVDVSYSNKPTSRPRVRNFDRSRKQAPKEVCVYSIIKRNGVISVAGRSILRQRGSNENPIIIKKRILRLPVINQNAMA